MADDPYEALTEALRAADARRAAEAEEEEKRKGKGASIDDGNAASIELGANIRPDVVAAPGGLVTVTTQKSSTYQPGDDDAALFLENRDEWSSPTLAPDAQPAAEVDKPTLTLALIEQNPRNAVDLPLPEDASPTLIEAAHLAAKYEAEINNLLTHAARAGEYSEHWSREAFEAGSPQPDVHEYNEAQAFSAEQRADALAQQRSPDDFNEAPPEPEQRQNMRPNEPSETRSGDDDGPAEASMSASDYLSARLAEAKAEKAAEREAGGENVREAGNETGNHITRGFGPAD